MLGALISAFILCGVIKGFTDEEVGFGKAFLTAFLAAIVGGIGIGVATASIESAVLGIAIALAIYFVVTLVVVQLLCSTDFKTVVKIALAYIGIEFCWRLALIFLVGAL